MSTTNIYKSLGGFEIIIIEIANFFSNKKDPRGNVLKKLNGVNTNRGVFSDEYELSDVPILGDWKIRTAVGKQVCFHAF